jgi:alcohol dehydrogenase class IV
MTLPTSQFSIPTTVRFGHGEINNLAEHLERIGASNPLVVTDPGMLQTKAYQSAREVLEASSLSWGLFGHALPNPTEDNVDEAAAQYRKDRHDSLVALGGGSAIDVAKAVAIRVSYEGRLEDFVPPPRGAASLPPLIAVPTTAGTGSEVGRSSVIILRSTGRKSVLFDPRLMPAVALIDPDLTLDLPPRLTAATGMDAFTHCLESYVSNVFHPIADAIAYGGLELVIKNLPIATRDGQNREARGYMMIAAMMGALAFQKDLGAAHSMAHPLSSISGLHHGLANAIVLPTVMEFNRETVKDRFARVASLFDPKAVLLSAGEASRLAVQKVRDLNKELGIPASLKEAGVKETDLAALAEGAFQDGCHPTNPRPCTVGDFRELFQQAYAG